MRHTPIPPVLLLTVFMIRSPLVLLRPGAVPKAREGQTAEHAASAFQEGAAWVREVLGPAIERGNAELKPENVAFQLDVNLDPRSTNHAHADFWLSEMGEGQRAVGPKCSINVVGGQTVWLYKPGAELSPTLGDGRGQAAAA
jgi:hypothetical protein